MAQPSTAEIEALQRRYTGLDDKLEYIEGHTIATKYEGYKKAQAIAGTASSFYKSTHAALAYEKPYPTGVRLEGPVRNKMFDQRGHEVLDPLAGDASITAGFHAERRESFNMTYEPVLRAKSEWIGHEKQAMQARGSEAKYRKLQEKHQSYYASYQSTSGR